jgi:hypothetical protein
MLVTRSDVQVMDKKESAEYVERVMIDFARLTGLEPVTAHPIRYLWTDAFAVCNYLELHRITEERTYLDLAVRLVHQVHHTLGRHRDDDERKGWISGLSEEEGELQPTAGGLRIGKNLRERKAGEPIDEYLEWERDGQYYHYLTKWMHALNRVGQVTSDPAYSVWAVQLAKRANSAFCYQPSSGGGKRMYWKMSIDLGRPLVMSMGQHDPLDGYVTYNELQVTALRSKGRQQPELVNEIDDIGKIMRLEGLATDDSLGMGGLLIDASRIAQVMEMGGKPKAGLLEAVIDAALFSIGSYALGGDMELDAESRLAFRELGLSIGLKGLPRMKASLGRIPKSQTSDELLQKVTDLERFTPIGDGIDKFWTSPKNQRATTWSDHSEINMVMLATSLAPDSFLSI